jgi:uncharacterized protein with HEPN domain
MGEAARRVSREFRDRHPQIPWAKVIGMRHEVVHDYLSVDCDLVWDVVTVNPAGTDERPPGSGPA